MYVYSVFPENLKKPWSHGKVVNWRKVKKQAFICSLYFKAKDCFTQSKLEYICENYDVQDI